MRVRIFFRNFAAQLKVNGMIGLKTMLLFGLGGQEVLLIALIVLLLFGGKKIPEMMRGLGKGVKSFKDGMTEIEEDTTTDDKH